MIYLTYFIIFSHKKYFYIILYQKLTKVGTLKPCLIGICPFGTIERLNIMSLHFNCILNRLQYRTAITKQ